LTSNQLWAFLTILLLLIAFMAATRHGNYYTAILMMQ